MKLTIHDDPELLTQRLRALQNLKSSKVKVGLPASAGGRLHWFTKTPRQAWGSGKLIALHMIGKLLLL